MEIIALVLLCVFIIAVVSGGTAVSTPIVMGGDRTSKANGCVSLILAAILIGMAAIMLLALSGASGTFGPLEIRSDPPGTLPTARVAPARVAPRPTPAKWDCATPPGLLGERMKGMYTDATGRNVDAVCTVNGWVVAK